MDPRGYQELYRQSVEEPETFWAAAAREIQWDRAPRVVLDNAREPYTRWFPDGRLNTCHNALDRHVLAGRAHAPALIYDSPVTGEVRTYTYGQMLAEVARLAGALSRRGVGRGDRVLIYMPMVPEAVLAMLACARIGAVHSVIFGGFAARELALRLDHATPKAVLAASCGLEPGRVVQYKPLLDEALRRARHSPELVAVLQREPAPAELKAHELDWAGFVEGAQPVGCTTVESGDPLYLLYTSGTTGRPKGIVRDNGGHAVALTWSMRNVYGVGRDETFWAASDIGWVVGHSYIVYGPLLAGATTVLYEGKPVGTPDAGAFWRAAAQHRVSTLFTAPTALRAIKREDARGSHLAGRDLSALRALFLAGERTDPDTYHWARELLGVPVVDHWWQTETGWPIAASCLGIETAPLKAGSASKPVPGFVVDILDDDGHPLPVGQQGAVALRLPLPPGTLVGLWQDSERFLRSYMSRYPGYYSSGDGGYMDGDGYLYVMGRMDDVINVAGHRLSTGAIEEVISAHPAVAECAVVGVADPLKGQLPLALVVLKEGTSSSAEEILAQVRSSVREEIGAIASLRAALQVPRLPKTRSGKVLRAVIRSIADGEEYAMPSTIEDPGALQDVTDVLRVPAAASLQITGASS